VKWPTIRQRGEEDLGNLEPHLPNLDKLGHASPDLRALRLAMTISDSLLSMGVAASSVVSRVLDVTETYCSQPVHVDISSNLVMLSQIRGLEAEPLTIFRPVVTRDVNNMTIQSVQDLVYRIRDGQLKLEQAEAELDRILKHPITYPNWLIPLANAALAAGVDLMFTTNWRIILITFIIVWLVDRLVIFLSKKGISTFFRQAAAGAFVTLGAAVINLLASRGMTFFDDMNPTIVVVGGIIMLLSGLAIVGAIQDAIDEYYITANARILKVTLLTSGIVMGVLIGLYAARKVGMGIAVSPNPLHLTSLHFQIVGGAIAAGALAVATQTRLRAVVWAGFLGALALLIMYSGRNLGISVVPASGVAALVVGVLAKLLSRAWRTPSSGVTAAAIVPLVPGLSLYTALMQLVNYPPGDPLFTRGLGTLFTAVAIALAIAAGASFGNVLARPFSQRQTHLRNFLPFASFMRHQLQVGHRSHLARLALFRHKYDLDQEQADQIKT
jgi:uncharacterized membrane protein YjjP (DUF1212 family)